MKIFVYRLLCIPLLMASLAGTVPAFVMQDNTQSSTPAANTSGETGEQKKDEKTQKKQLKANEKADKAKAKAAKQQQKAMSAQDKANKDSQAAAKPQ